MENGFILPCTLVFLNIAMTTDDLIASGNLAREQHRPEQAIACYAQAFVQDPNHSGAFNNYGNVLREMGHAQRAIPFLETARLLDPASVKAVGVTNILMALNLNYLVRNGKVKTCVAKLSWS